MELALKQRLLGAAVLVALAVTFLPMLVTDPAPAGGASDVPLRVPSAPDSGAQTREMQLVEPATPSGPVLPEATSAVDASVGAGSSAAMQTPAGTAGAASTARLPASTAAGNYAVNFGSYASPADAARVIAALRAAHLPAYQEPVALSARTVYRVRVGPYASQADAEAARLQAARIRDDVGAKVVVLDARPAGAPSASAAGATAVVAPVSAASATSVTPKGASPASVTPAVAAQPGAGKSDVDRPNTATAAATPARPAITAPTATTPAAAMPLPPSGHGTATVNDSTPPVAKPAAAGVGFAVQLGAFTSADDANRLRDKARAAGFTAFVEPVRSEHGTLSRVRIGPVADRAEADRLRGQVSAKLGIDGIVRPHP